MSSFCSPRIANQSNEYIGKILSSTAPLWLLCLGPLGRWVDINVVRWVILKNLLDVKEFQGKIR
jgi:hypothetical protein